MSELNLSKVEIPLRSKSMANHQPSEIDILSIKQIGDYILGEEIGSGAFGKVLLGKHILTEEKVAIKVLDKMILNQTPEDYELVKKEISILKLVKHKYIVQLYEILQTAQHIFIIMEYCEGKEILDYILTKNRLTEQESLKYFQQLINCLFYLHSQNIAHRDIKIDNMLLDSNNDLKLIDFGLSTKYTDDDLLDQPCGTVVYAAPEVLEGKEYHGMLADVWSSGIVLFGMLAGYLPFSDKDDEENKKQVIKGKINLPDFFSDQVKDLLKHMLDVNPMTRYTLQEIKDHPWFNTIECDLIPGIIIDYNIIPIDDKIINLCVSYNKDKNDVINSIKNNKYDSNSALYYLLIKKLVKNGGQSISDMCSEEFIDFVLDENNLINKENNNNKEEKNENSFEINKEKKDENDKSDKNRENIDIKEENKDVLINNEDFEEINDNNLNNNSIHIYEYINDEFHSPEKKNKDILIIESNDEQKKTNSPLIKKNYDIDETYTNKESGGEKIEIKNSQEITNDERKENKEEVKKFDEKEIINAKKEYEFEQIDLKDERRLTTDIIDNSKIIEKIMKNLENNINKIQMLEVDIKNISNKNNIGKEKNDLILKENKEPNVENNLSKEENNFIMKKDNSKLINSEINRNIKILEGNTNENISKKEYKNELKEKNKIKKNENSINKKEKKSIIKEKEKSKKFDKNKVKINKVNKNLYNNTKKNINKSNNLSNQIKTDLTKQKNFGIMTPMTEQKNDKKKAVFRMKNKNKIGNNINTEKKLYNFSSRNSKNKLILINNRIKSNQKILHKNIEYTNLKRKTSNKIFNIINIINNNYNSTGSEIKIKNYYHNSKKNDENLNITNLQKKFDEMSVQHIKELNYNNINISPEKSLSNSKKKNERNKYKSNNNSNTKTNNITIIIQNKKEINKNGNLLKSIINIDNKNIINLSDSKSKRKSEENNKNKKFLRKKNLESSVQEKRYKSPLDVRELSESPKHKYMNKKTRLTKIPWKLKKKGIDNKLDSKQVYKNYKMIIKNPFNQNNNKIKNINRSIKNSFCNSIRSSICDTKKSIKSSFAKNIKEIKVNHLFPKNIKQIKTNNRNRKEDLSLINGKGKKETITHNNSKAKDNKIFNSNSKLSNVNSLFSLSNSNININSTDMKTSFTNIKKQSVNYLKKSISNAISINLNKKFIKNENEYNNIYIPMNLSCLFIKTSDINNYKNQIISKLKKNIISYVQKKNNCLVCNKNGYNCDIQILKLNANNKKLLTQLNNNENSIDNKSLYYLKMYGKKETFGINNIYKKFILNLE